MKFSEATVETAAGIADSTLAYIMGIEMTPTPVPFRMQAAQWRTLIDAAASSHSHAISDVTGLQTALDGKSTLGHGHAIADVTGLQAAIDGKLASSAVSAFGGTLIDDADAATARGTLGLGTLATQNGTFSGTSSGTNTGDQTITLTGDVSGSGTTTFDANIVNNAVTTAKIINSAVTNAKLANVATGTIKGRVTAATGVVEDLTGTQATTLLDVFTTSLKGLAPASGGGTTNFLRADGTWAAPGGGGTPGGSDTHIQFNDGGAFGGSSNLTWNDNTLAINGGTVTASTPPLDVSQTWNSGGTTFTGIKFNATSTASAAASKLLDLQVGGTTAFSVARTGVATIGNSSTTGTIATLTNSSGSTNLSVTTTASLQTDTPIVIAAGTATGAGKPALSITQTWNSGIIPFDGIKLNVTDTASTAASKLLDLQIAGTSRAYVNKDGNLVLNANLTRYVTIGRSSSGDAYPGIWFTTTTPSYTNYSFLYDNPTDTSLLNGVNGVQMRVGNNNLLKSTSSGVAVAADKPLGFSPTVYGLAELTAAPDVALNRDAANTLALRNGTNAQDFRVYNTYTSSTTLEYLDLGFNSNVAEIGTVKGSVGGTARDLVLKTDNTERLRISSTGAFTIADAKDISVGTTTGTKIGTATGQKLGFWNATPVVQQVLATGAGATVDNVISLLQTLGLCKQS